MPKRKCKNVLKKFWFSGNYMLDEELYKTHLQPLTTTTLHFYTNCRVGGSSPGFPDSKPHVGVSLNKTLYPKPLASWRGCLSTRTSTRGLMNQVINLLLLLLLLWASLVLVRWFCYFWQSQSSCFPLCWMLMLYAKLISFISVNIIASL